MTGKKKIEQFMAKAYFDTDEYEKGIVWKSFGPALTIEEITDEIEEVFDKGGLVGQTFADIYFNGSGIHSSLYFVGFGAFGVYNYPDAPYPMEYVVPGSGGGLYDLEKFGRNAADINAGNQGGDDSEEFPDDANEDDEGDDEEESEEEPEMKRPIWFGKFKGPSGWRKRAETSHDRYQNVMTAVFGVLAGDEGDSNVYREGDRRVRVELREFEKQGKVKLSISLPRGVELVQSGRRWTAEISHNPEEDNDD